MTDYDVPVLIAGGGGAGLTASMTLSALGVDNLLVTAFPTTSVLPKAHVLNQRTMEIFTELGLGERIYAQGTPQENLRYTGWYAGLAGPHADYGRELGRLEIWGSGYRAADYIAASPCATTNLPQIRLEPVLRERAEELNPGRIRFNHEVVAIENEANGVVATVRDKDADEVYTVRARYLIGADGGRTVGRAVGVKLKGIRDIMKMVSVHLTADLSAHLDGDDVLIRWLVNPDFGDSFASGILVPMGPDNWGTRSEEWVFHMSYPVDDPSAAEPDKVLARMRTTLGIENFHPEVHAISQWTMEGVIADRFRIGSVFLVGDAAHRHPPTGGLGLNSAVQDAHNLGWKLAAVLRGGAGDPLLDTYEAERKPVDQANIDNSVASAMSKFLIDQALGLSADKSPEENWAELRPLWEDLPASSAKRAGLHAALAQQTIEFHHHNIEYGYTYTSSAVAPDGTPVPEPLDPVRLYAPSSRPGHPMPHAWVQGPDGVLPLGRLTHDGHFLLVTGEEGHDWVEAAAKIAAEHQVPLRAVRVGAAGADYLDLNFAWTRHREVGPGGAVLVRPDRFVAFRSMDAVDDPKAVLVEALRSVLSTTTLS